MNRRKLTLSPVEVAAQCMASPCWRQGEQLIPLAPHAPVYEPEGLGFRWAEPQEWEFRTRQGRYRMYTIGELNEDSVSDILHKITTMVWPGQDPYTLATPVERLVERWSAWL